MSACRTRARAGAGRRYGRVARSRRARSACGPRAPRPRGELLLVALPDRPAPRLDALPLDQLGVEERPRGGPRGRRRSRGRPSCSGRSRRGRNRAPVSPLLAQRSRRPLQVARSLTTRAPPSPEVKFLVSWKERVERAPRVPSIRPFHLPRKPWALSSTTAAPAFSAVSRWSPSRRRRRRSGTGMIARVRGVTRSGAGARPNSGCRDGCRRRPAGRRAGRRR